MRSTTSITATWLMQHGATKTSVNSRFITGIYDLVFAYRDGDRQQPAARRRCRVAWRAAHVLHVSRIDVLAHALRHGRRRVRAAVQGDACCRTGGQGSRWQPGGGVAGAVPLPAHAARGEVDMREKNERRVTHLEFATGGRQAIARSVRDGCARRLRVLAPRPPYPLRRSDRREAGRCLHAGLRRRRRRWLRRRGVRDGHRRHRRRVHARQRRHGGRAARTSIRRCRRSGRRWAPRSRRWRRSPRRSGWKATSSRSGGTGARASSRRWSFVPATTGAGPGDAPDLPFDTWADMTHTLPTEKAWRRAHDREGGAADRRGRSRTFAACSPTRESGRAAGSLRAHE